MRNADAYPFPRLGSPARYGAAVAAVVAVFLLQKWFDPLIDEGSLFLMLGLGVIGSAWFGGTGPALLATVTGALLEASAPTSGPAVDAHLAWFLANGLVLTAILSELRRARLRAEQHTRIAEEALRERESTSRLKDEFLATVSHELRTPLNAVLGWVHLLRTGRLDSDTAARGLESIERNARLQSQLTGNLLDISRALTGRLLIESRQISLSDIVRQATAAAMPAAHAKGVTMVRQLRDEPVVVLGDWSRLRQAVWHLLTNALKFTSRGGRIDVELRHEGDDAVVTIVDSGVGIDAAFLPRIFDPFTQEDSSPTRTAGGLGVGLSLVREIVELHGGRVSAANRLDDRGAIFTVRLPRQPAPEPAEALRTSTRAGGPATAAGPNGSPPLRGLLVLVLDRDRDGRDLVATLLRDRGAVVRTTDTVAEALESLESWRPDVLVSDVGSPDHNCYQVFGKVPSLEAERGGRIPALALTNLARTDEHVREMLAAALADLPKPVEPALLTSEIARLTGRERRREAR
jgi:signal transduction histidine kinase/CheY-like chemotaxis protein